MRNHRNNDKSTVRREYSRIEDLYSLQKYEQALMECNDFIEKYPYMEKIRFIKTAILRLYGKYDEALSVLDDSYNYYSAEAQLERLKIYLCQERYDEAYILKQLIDSRYADDLTETQKEELTLMDMSLLLKTNESEFNKKYSIANCNNYKMKQFINYDVNQVINYMTSRANNNSFKRNWSFNKRFNIGSELIKYKDKVLYKEPISGVYYDLYYFPYPNCGKYFNRDCDYLAVYTIKGTNNIVEMKPSIEEFIKEPKKEDTYSSTPVHKRDMVKRFNDRYRRNK